MTTPAVEYADADRFLARIAAFEDPTDFDTVAAEALERRKALLDRDGTERRLAEVAVAR